MYVPSSPSSQLHFLLEPVIEQFNGDIDKMECEKFIAAFYTEHLLTDALSLYSSVIPSFSREPDKWIYEGYTVTYVCLQLAFYMGFSTILLIGVDHSYKFEGYPNEMVIAEGKDKNHFHPEYFSNGRKWHNPDLIQSERAYRIAKMVYGAEGRDIINLTPGAYSLRERVLMDCLPIRYFEKGSTEPFKLPVNLHR